jgi:hypothetical protein
VNALLQAGADKSISDWFGRKPVRHASGAQKNDIIDALR